MTPSLEGLPTKAKEAPSPHEVRMSPLDTNPVFQSLGGDFETVTNSLVKIYDLMPFFYEVTKTQCFFTLKKIKHIFELKSSFLFTVTKNMAVQFNFFSKMILY